MQELTGALPPFGFDDGESAVASLSFDESAAVLTELAQIAEKVSALEPEPERDTDG